MNMIIADLQLHSRFSRACSKNTTLPLLEKYARIKGINLLTTGDFQHPIWNKEIKSELKEDENGILWSKTKFPFVWGTEVSLMYSDGGRRAIHHLIFAPNREVADQVTERLKRIGRIDYDGRPIFGMSSPELVEIMHEISSRIEIIPAHCMTPWFGLFGSKSGFNSLKDCFKEKTNKIHAVETGMSADPGMLWRLKEEVNLVSFSDAHSYWPWRLGRETTVFDCDLSYNSILKAIRTGQGLKETIEVDPNYGKYHFDGHRNCNICFSPEQSMMHKDICPVCKKPLTIGVMHRIEELAINPPGYKPKNFKPYKTMLPLSEVISAFLGVAVESKSVWEVYNKLIEKFGSEFNVMLNVNETDLKNVVNVKLAGEIIKNRKGLIEVDPGYDGVYGKPKIEGVGQARLHQF